MEVEVSGRWDGGKKKVGYMERLGGLMGGMGGWVRVGDDDREEGKMGKEVGEMGLKRYGNGVEGESGEYLLWREEGESVVDGG